MGEWGIKECIRLIGVVIYLLFGVAALLRVYMISKRRKEASEREAAEAVKRESAEKEAAEAAKIERLSDGRYDKVTFIETAWESEDGFRW